ncbi:DNA polymerase [Novosphingobium capsulatum]|uniref:DNA polymerase n=1 Tax=Novosphingobium capsulatum TaxID=13688 RepID=A0ABU1MHT7_9SPHN|nr:uracil-DNA glycosylase family protein [Novosphingobium capsulatum]MDR6509743.1 DNA polymerase [Novosphingobium capsulatum]
MSQPPAGTAAGHSLSTLVDAAFAWWEDAGLDGMLSDTPQSWLESDRKAAAKANAKAGNGAASFAPPPPPPAMGGLSRDWPQTLDDFHAWWLETPSLPFPPARRIAPTGPAGAPLMILLPMPEADDEAGLLSGRGGKVVDGMLAALGLAREQVYCAAALPVHVPMPDWGQLRAEGLGALLAHHAALAAPQRVLILGRSGISTLLGHSLPNNAADLREFNHDGGCVPAVFAYDLAALVARPAHKAALWNRLLDWTGTDLT